MSLRHRAVLPVFLSAAIALGGVACSEDEPTPEEARHQRVEERLKLSFSDEEVACMLEEFDESILMALDREGNLPQGPDLEVFSATAQSCVLEKGSTVPTGADASSSTVPSSTTTGEVDDTAPTTEPAPETDPTTATEPDSDTSPPSVPDATRPDAGPDGSGNGGSGGNNGNGNGG